MSEPLDKNPIKDIIEGDFEQRIHELDTEACSFDVAKNTVDVWRRAGQFSVFNAGSYDILTLNHVLGLVQCRTLGAMALLGVRKIESKQMQHLVHDVAASDSIQLMVTLDTNKALEEGKSRRLEKGGAPKPTLDWRNRAIMLAMQSIPSPDYTARRSVVDYITRHGPECCKNCAPNTCTNEDNALMAVEIQPDMVVVNAHSTRTVTDLARFKAEGKLPNTLIATIVEEDNQYFDPILEGPIKTTSIIDRVRS